MSDTVELPPTQGYVKCKGCPHSNIMHSALSGKCQHVDTGWVPRDDCSYPTYPCLCKGWKNG